MKKLKTLLFIPVIIMAIMSCQKSGQEQEKEQSAGRPGSQESLEHIIPMSKAIEYSRRFIHLRDTVLPGLLSNPAFLEEYMEMPFAETFCREAIDNLLAVGGTASVRIYLGVDEVGKLRLILLPVDDEGNNIITNLSGESARGLQRKSANTEDEEDGDAIDNGHRPPPPSGSL